MTAGKRVPKHVFNPCLNSHPSSGLKFQISIESTPRVSLLRRLQDGKFGFYSYDFFQPRDVIGWESLDLRYVWSRDEPVTAAAEIFADQTMFHGRHFTIGTNPWSHHVQGYEVMVPIMFPLKRIKHPSEIQT